MTVSQQIKADYGTVIRFARLHGLPEQNLYALFSGRYEYTTAVNVLIEAGYIKSVDDLRKAA